MMTSGPTMAASAASPSACVIVPGISARGARPGAVAWSAVLYAQVRQRVADMGPLSLGSVDILD